MTASKDLLLTGGILGAVLIFLVALSVMCCRSIRSRTSEEAREKRAASNKKAYAAFQVKKAADKKAKEEKEAKRRTRKRRGVVDGYDAKLDASFAGIMSGGAVVGDAGEDSDVDEAEDLLSLSSSDGQATPVAFGRRRSMSKISTGTGYSLPAALNSESDDNARSRSPQEQQQGDSLDAFPDTAATLDEAARGKSSTRRGYLPPVISFSPYGPRLPRNAAEEQLASHHQGYYAAHVQEMIADARQREALRHEGRDAKMITHRRDLEERLLEGRKMWTGLSPASQIRPPPLLGPPEPFRQDILAQSNRLCFVPTTEYFKSEL